eukprot:TRINITY_DN39684_c0_g1_i1.p1 TRINITY_DN39684_c0_g1~~TRINITY_DN39684_c0_g1_i1.p1  ORF type:complete len:338 (+),score=48.97 TRINITY_DN39684_c0_g1_i1:66-1079(+)
MIRGPPRSPLSSSSAASDVYKRQGSVDQTARLWSQDGECVNIFAGHGDDVTAVLLQGDGVLLTGSDDHSIKAWSCADSTCLAIFNPPCRAGVTALAMDHCMLYAGFKDGMLCAFNLRAPCVHQCGEQFSYSQERQQGFHEHAQCPNRPVDCELGCGASMPASDHSEHIAGCSHRLVPCELACGATVEARALQEHATVCPHRIVQCAACAQTMRANELQGHQKDLCPCRVVCCPFDCGIAELQARHEHEHVSTACPNRVIPCPIGCSVQGLLCKHAAMHQAEACPHRIVRCSRGCGSEPVSYTHLRAHETVLDLVCRLLLETKKHTRVRLTSISAEHT